MEHEIISNPIITLLCKEVKGIERIFLKLHSSLEIQNLYENKSVSQGENENLSSRANIDFSKAGYLIPLACGHSGHYEDAERLLLEEHLHRVGFLE